MSYKTVIQSKSTPCLDFSFPHPGLWECPLDCEEFIRSRPQGPGDIWACQRSHLSPASTLTLPVSISLPRPHPRPVPPLDQGHLSHAAQPNPVGASCQQHSGQHPSQLQPLPPVTPTLQIHKSAWVIYIISTTFSPLASESCGRQITTTICIADALLASVYRVPTPLWTRNNRRRLSRT